MPSPETVHRSTKGTEVNSIVNCTPPLILWSPWKHSGSWISFPQLCAFVISRQFFPGLVEIRSLPICLWNHDYLYAPLKTASLKIVKKKQNASLFLLFSGFWLPTALLELPSRDAFSREAGATPVPTPFLHHLSLRCTQQLLGSSREGLYLCFSSSGKSSLTQAKFNRPVQIGGPWKIPGEEMSISCYFSLFQAAKHTEEVALLSPSLGIFGTYTGTHAQSNLICSRIIFWWWYNS